MEREMSEGDAGLKNEAAHVIEERDRLGLSGLVGDLEFVIINTEPDRQRAAVEELLKSTGFECRDAHEDEHSRDCVLSAPGSADIIVRSRKTSANPFAEINNRPMARKMPNTRLETLVFGARDLKKYVSIQQSRGARFLTDDIQQNDNYSFIQTPPSNFTGNSIGFVEWRKGRREYAHSGCKPLDWQPVKPDRQYLKNIKHLDHVATRVAANDRDSAIIEFMSLTNYNFDIAIYVEALNSITNVARLSNGVFAHVFTSGISRYVNDEVSGPTEKFVHYFGARTHHMAFHAERIEETYDALAKDGMRYLVELVGSPEEGLKQTFTVPFENTMIVNEYIHRYGDFDGFFTKSNVTLLTKASDFSPND